MWHCKPNHPFTDIAKKCLRVSSLQILIFIPWVMKPIHAVKDKHSEHELNKKLNSSKRLKFLKQFFYNLLTYVISLICKSTNLPKRAVLPRSWQGVVYLKIFFLWYDMFSQYPFLVSLTIWSVHNSERFQSCMQCILLLNVFRGS